MQIHLEREGDSELLEDLARFLKRHPRVGRIVLNPAGFTFLMGVFLSVGIVIGWLGILVVDAEVASKMVAMEATELAAGREVAIPFGLITLGLPALIVFGIAFTNDLVTTSFLYPLFYIFRRRQRERDTFMGYFFRKMERDAEERRDVVEKYGAIGLFFFMLIPFAINGPLIGAILGKLVGIRTRYILPTVVLATATATAAWTLAWVYFQDQVTVFVERFDGPWIPLAIVALVLLVMSKVLLGFLRDMHNYRRIKRRRRAIAERLQAGTVVQVLHAEAQGERSEPKAPQTESP